jgi:phosphatidate cytidylyltransferase
MAQQANNLERPAYLSSSLMAKRILTAVVLIPPVIYLIGWAPLWLLVAAIVIVAELSLHEYFALAQHAGLRTLPTVGHVFCAGICLAQVADLRGGGEWLPLSLAGAVLAALTSGLAPGALDRCFLPSVATTLSGILYAGLSLSFLVPLRFADDPRFPATGRQLLLFLFLVVWAGDIFAYATGKCVGRRPFFQHISPNKTLEGAIGGLMGSLAIGAGFAHWFWRTTSLITAMLLAGMVAVAGQAGDLAESALKRGANLKDSGHILPGHGGMLDRVDSLLFGAPALWLAVQLLSAWG